MIDPGGNIPVFLTITDRKTQDEKIAPQVPIESDGIYLVDRAYTDFSWLWSVDQAGAFFVSRLKTSINWNRILSHKVDKSVGLRSDQEIIVTSKRLKRLYPKRLRRASFRDEAKSRTLVFLTNNFSLSASTIAELYKACWEIEMFFKWIKQNLKIKTFFGRSPNAVKTHIWIAMVVYLVVAIVKQGYQSAYSPSKSLHLLEVNLFEQMPLHSAFLNDARHISPRNVNQLTLFDY